MFQNGLRQLTLGGPPVVARRLHEYLWEDPNGKVVEGYNGTIWEIVLKDPTGNPITKEVKVTVFFDAVKAARSANEINAIQVDPSDTFGYELYTGDCPPGLPYASHVTGVPLALWKPEDVCLSPVFYTGNKGHIPEGKHRVALEAKIEGKPVYRCLFDISVPPLIESMPQKDWVKSIPESGVEVSVVDKSVCWPSEQEISWKVQIRADPAQLKPPLGIVRYFQASDHKNVASSVWTADPYKDNRINTSIEIEGFNRWEHSWGAGWDGMPTFKNDVAIQPITVHCGPRGKFQGGKHPVAIEISSRGDPVWRGILSLEVPAKTWSFSDNQNLLDITTEDDKDIRNTIIPAVRAGPHKEKGLSNGLSFGPWKFKNKGQPLTGTFLVQYYVKAMRAPLPPSGFATMSAGPYASISIFDKPDEGGFTAFVAAGMELSNQNGTKGQFSYSHGTFYVGEDKTQPGDIPEGIHEVGIEILQQKDSNPFTTIYRGITKLELK